MFLKILKSWKLNLPSKTAFFDTKNVLMNYITTYFWTVKINVNKNILKILKSWKVKYPSETGLLEGVIYFP